ncbi:Oidioi.mRNA.OKI2018_I69.PAR.g8500.t1.cds [Oikopleura dioica]|uniref:Oidioi.mRNA.OKI2018_I69.PAR.g8500.t1.cds n=1 Tax=Oikopleura dioica TaxID=34765 RepID=A0ABN7RJL8_OIKDI|nr:Oidioi.mRNA.OKI2018_I69.PAR.g8500.t1.cds [Oikopleura dioica]
MKGKLSFKKQESSEDPSTVPLNVVVNVSNQVNSPAEKKEKKEKKDKKSCLNKLKGLSLILKIAVALLTIHGIITPLILSKMNAHSDSQDDSTITKASDTLRLQKEIEELKSGRSLMVLSGLDSQTVFLSYVLKSDGSKSPLTIKMPSYTSHYLYLSYSALIRGKVYIFGGVNENDFHIAMINDCEIEELDVKLNNHYYWNAAVVTAADQQSALICFDEKEWRNCEEFNGSAVSIKPATKYYHRNSCLALYHDHAVAVGSWVSDAYKKVEEFNGDSWSELPDFPKAIFMHSCIGVYDGFLVLGGKYEENEESHSLKDVYLLRDLEWTVVGQLNEYHLYSSAARIGNTIYLVSGRNEPYAVEKLEWDGEQIASAEVVNNHWSEFHRPIVLPVDEFYCT